MATTTRVIRVRRGLRQRLRQASGAEQREAGPSGRPHREGRRQAQHAQVGHDAADDDGEQQRARAGAAR